MSAESLVRVDHASTAEGPMAQRRMAEWRRRDCRRAGQLRRVEPVPRELGRTRQ